MYTFSLTGSVLYVGSIVYCSCRECSTIRSIILGLATFCSDVVLFLFVVDMCLESFMIDDVVAFWYESISSKWWCGIMNVSIMLVPLEHYTSGASCGQLSVQEQTLKRNTYLRVGTDGLKLRANTYNGSSYLRRTWNVPGLQSFFTIKNVEGMFLLWNKFHWCITKPSVV